MIKVWKCELCKAIEESSFLPDGWLRIPQPGCKRDVYCLQCLKQLPASILPKSGKDGTILIEDSDSLWDINSNIVNRQRLVVKDIGKGFLCIISHKDDSIYVGE